MASRPPFILVESDVERGNAFVTASEAAKKQAAVGSTGNAVRRPMRGYQIKEDTYSTMVVRSASGESPTLANSSGETKDSLNFTSNFIIQSVSESRSEKFQPITTFGATYGFFFGETPRVLTYQAVLLNSADFQWEAEWWDNYDKVVRGTRLVDRQSRVYLFYDEVVVEGYLINASTQKTSTAPFEVPLSFSMWVTGIEYLTPGGVGDVNFPAAQSGGQEGIQIDYDSVQTAGGEVVPVTPEMRNANIAALKNKELGFLASLRNNLQQTSGSTDNQINAGRDALFGRNLVVPAGFVDSTGGQSISNGTTVRLPASFVPDSPAPRSRFFDNIDEYLSRKLQTNSSFPEPVTAVDPQAAMEGQLRTAMVTRGAGKKDKHELRTRADKKGWVDLDVCRTLGSSSFAAVSAGGTETSETATDGELTAAQEQARAEALSS